jgi:hypothetical protein
MLISLQTSLKKITSRRAIGGDKIKTNREFEGYLSTALLFHKGKILKGKILEKW